MVHLYSRRMATLLSMAGLSPNGKKTKKSWSLVPGILSSILISESVGLLYGLKLILLLLYPRACLACMSLAAAGNILLLVLHLILAGRPGRGA